MFRYHKLLPEVEKIICQKSTKSPGSGKYDRFQEAGSISFPKRCDAALYISSNKFSSGCGWPSFDEEIQELSLRIPDPDRKR